MARQDPLRNFHFRLEIDQVEQAGFSEMTLGELSADPIEYREGPEHTTLRKLTGLHKYGKVTLRRGVTMSAVLADWHQSVIDDAVSLDESRRDVLIRILDEAGEEQAAFEIVKAWPCKYDPMDLNAAGSEAAIDTLELCNEGIRRIR